MTVQLLDITLISAGYLLGSVASAIVVCRIWSLPDPRLQGSGNPGATNVLRIGGKAPAAATLIGDVLKGLVPVSVGHGLGAAETTVAVIALAAFLGHLYPVFFNFQGGKGVATAFGALIGLDLWAALLVLSVWLTVVLLTRLSSLAALSASLLAPVILWLLDQPHAHSVALAMMSILLIWRHQANIQRLLTGQESRIGDKSSIDASIGGKRSKDQRGRT